jgi:PAS domain S-box-containing protein
VRLAGLLLLAMTVAGPVAAAQPGLVVLTAETRELPLREELELLRDDAGAITYEQLASDSVVFRPATPTDNVSHGYTTAAYWYRVTLRNAGGDAASADWVLEADFAPLDYVDFYVARAGAVTHVATGDQRPIAAGQLPYRSYAVPLRIAPGERVQVHVRVQTSTSHQVPLTLWSRDAFFAAATRQSIGYGLFFGIMLIMALYNSVIALFVRDRAYVYYVFNIASFALLQAAMSGYLYRLLQPYLTSYAIHNRWVVVFSAATLASILLFARALLGTRTYTPRMHRAINAMLIVVAGFFVASFALPYGLGTAGFAVLGALGGALFIASGVAALRAGVRTARFYLAAWSVFMACMLVKVLELFGAFPPTVLTAHAWEAGALVTVTLLSLALADRINLERKEKIAAQAEALQAREHAIDSLARYQRIVDAVPEGIFETDTEGRIINANPAMATMLGYIDLAEMRASVRDFRRDHVRDPEAADALIARLRAEGRLTGYEVELVRRNGSAFWAALSIRRLVDDTGAARAQGIIQDITERREREELTRGRAAAEAATSAKSDFLAKMSHELRTPMNAIIGFADLALRSDSDARRLEHVGNIRAASRTLLRIIDDILDLSKIEAGKLVLEHRGFDLDAVLEQVAMLLSQEAAAKGLALKVSHAPQTPLALVGDPLRLEQVLVNLVGNAVKFTENGEVELSVELASRTDRRARLRFMVRDTGIGLSPEEQSRLFAPFAQADPFSTRRRGGTGLGLAISKQLVEKMGGRIAVESQPGVGSVFLFTAEFGLGSERVAAPGATAVAPPPSPPAVSPPPTPRTAVLRGARVLLVEDNALNRRLAQEILRPSGLVLDMAENGADAIAAVRQTAYNAVLMDVQMPGMDGLEATRRIRALPGSGALPIVALTANAMERDRQECLAAGMSDFLSKPVDADQLLLTLSHWVGGAVAPLAQAPARTGFTGPQPTATPPPTLPPVLPGIDLASAVRRLGNRENLVLDVLHGMLRQYGDAPEQLRASVEARRIEDARLAAHTLKGLAATTGCMRLSTAAREAELAIKSGSDLEAPLGALEAALDEVRDSAARLPAPTPRARAATEAPVDVPAELERLLRLLRASDSAAQEQFELLRPALAQRLAPGALEGVARAIHVFDFDSAAAALSTAAAGTAAASPAAAAPLPPGPAAPPPPRAGSA